MICKICGKELSGKGLGSHLTTHKISAKEYYDKYLKQPNEGICPVCGKETPFLKISRGYQKCCSQSCGSRNAYEKVVATRIERYGVANFFQNKSIHKKAEKNAHSEEANKKKIETSQKHYGVDNPAQSEVVQSKIQQTNLERYGSRAYNHTKGRQTMKEKYGYEHALQVPEIKAKQEQTCMEKFGVYNWFPIELHHKDIFLNDTKFKEYIIDKYNENNKKRLRKKDINEYFNTNCIFKLKELHLMKYVQQHESKLENKFKELFNTHNIEYDWRNRSIIDGPNGKSHCYELDFYLPKYKIGIEINDIGTHNMNTLINSYYGKKYHVYKTNACKEKDIRLIHIWEWEIHKNFDKISTWLLNILNTDKTIVYGRKCQIKIVNVDEEKYFLNMYHLQGYTKSSICLGLYFNDELLEIMSFTKPRFTKKYEYELVRLCTKYNYSIIGGTEKLFNYFIKNYDPISIISYCDYSKFSGNIYQKIGMDFNKLSNPTIIYCNYYMNVINESILNKYGIDNLLGTHYGLHTNNKELIIKEGYLPIPNCGNLIYTYKKHNS